MGREIRRVPPKWDHPKRQAIRFQRNLGLGYVVEYQPMYDERFETVAEQWRREFLEWEATGRAEHRAETGDDLEFWVYSEAPPNPENYRPWTDEEATWFQLFETVSEGTPVSPPFATIEELAAYLAANGDFWDQKRGGSGWGRQAAERFCQHGWAPTFVSGDQGFIEGKLA